MNYFVVTTLSLGAICYPKNIPSRQKLSGRHCTAAMLLLSVLSVTACGGGGGTTAPATPNTATVTVSGKVTYTDFNLSASGIEYNNPISKPIRGAVVEMQSPVGTVLASANTTETGGYSFSSAPANASVRILVKAALGSPTTPDTRIIDNTSSGALYAMPMDVTTTTTNLSQDFNAGSGWDGSAYTSPRTAGPFAILDVIHQAQQLIKTADSAVVFPALNVNWSVNNKASSVTNAAIGDISSSFYDPNTKALFILGAANLDSDEYDSAVIGHEWGHYFEANFSRSDNPGGDHSLGEIVHPSLAFGEGFGTALGAIILNDPLYIDTTGANQANGDVNNLEEDSIADTDTFTGTNALLDGYYSENSVMEVVFDLFDGGTGDDDGIALGFTPMYRVLINGQEDTDAFTSIFSFLHHLKLEVPASSAAIDTVAQAENIASSRSNEFDDPADPILPFLYTTLTLNATTTLDADGFTLQTSSLFGTLPAGDDGNKLLNHRFFKTTVTTDGCYTLTATPVAPTASADLILVILGAGTQDDGSDGEQESVDGMFTAGEILTFNVGSFSDDTFFSVLFASTPAACTP